MSVTNKIFAVAVLIMAGSIEVQAQVFPDRRTPTCFQRVCVKWAPGAPGTLAGGPCVKTEMRRCGPPPVIR
jgi:hypothetical protein